MPAGADPRRLHDSRRFGGWTLIRRRVNTMDGYGIQKQAILGINDGLLTLFRTARSIPGLGDYSFGDWEKTCAGLPAQVAE
jgi:hypothetical protein